MSLKHLFAALVMSVYLLIVGFTDFQPTRQTVLKQDRETTQAIVLPEIIQPVTSKPPANLSAMPTKLTYEEHVEKEKAAKAISHLYPRVTFTRAMQVVTSVYDHSKSYGLKPSMVLAVMATESGFNRGAKSHRGAVGYLQVIPKYHRNKIRGRNLWDTDVNIQVGTQVLKECYTRHRSDHKALACFNGATTKQKANKYYKSVIKHQYALKRAITKVG